MKLFLKNIKNNPCLRNTLPFCLGLALLLALAGCGQSTYPADKVVESVKKLCRDEYNLDVEVRITGKTLGVAIPAEGLVTEDLLLNPDAGKKIEDVALSMRRVILSTDREIDFYIVCARDTKLIGAEYMMISSVLDVRRIACLDISRGEYFNRIQKSFELNPLTTGADKIRQLFNTLNQKIPAEFALSQYTNFGVSTEMVNQFFYPAILLAQPQTINYEILNIQSKQISKEEALFLVQVKETYAPQPGVYGTEVFPSGFINEYIIRADRAIYARPIAEIVPKFFAQDNQIYVNTLQQILDQYPDSRLLDEQGLPIQEIKLEDFLSWQIARRVTEGLENQAKAECRFENKMFKLNLNISAQQTKLLSQALLATANIIHAYPAQEFTGLEIKLAENPGLIYIAQDKLELFRKKGLTLEELLDQSQANDN